MKRILLFTSGFLALIACSCKKKDLNTTPPTTANYITSSHLKGTLKGVMKPDATYYLDGDMIVNPSDTLVVSAGDKVLATGNYHIEIAGTLICNGTDANPIYFTPQNEAAAYGTLGSSGYWGGFLIDSSSKYVSVTFTHINYTGGPDASGSAQASFDVEGIQTYDIGAKIIFEDNWMFAGIDDAIHLAGAITCSVKRNVLQRLGSSDGDLINIKYGAHGVVAYNYIWSSANSGIKLNTSKTIPLPETSFDIYNNTIINGNWRKVGELSTAILLDQNSSGNIYNNVIVGCRNGINLASGATGADMGHTKYSHNLIYMYYGTDSTNAESNNPYIPGSNGTPQSSDKIAFGLTACQSVFTTWSSDITSDLLDNNVPTLKAGSPALNAGTTNGVLYSYSIGSSVSLNKDMGAYPSDGSGNKHLPTPKP